jgi:hypothetical protein
MANLITIQTAMATETHLAKEVLSIQTIIISIIQNIIDSVNISLVLNRVSYLQGLIKAQFH